jgi:hypothetical protein
MSWFNGARKMFEYIRSIPSADYCCLYYHDDSNEIHQPAVNTVLALQTSEWDCLSQQSGSRRDWTIKRGPSR